MSEFAAPLPNLEGEIVPLMMFAASISCCASSDQLSASVDEVLTVSEYLTFCSVNVIVPVPLAPIATGLNDTPPTDA